MYEYLVWQVEDFLPERGGRAANIEWAGDPLPARANATALSLAVACFLQAPYCPVLILMPAGVYSHTREVWSLCLARHGVKGTLLDLPGVYDVAHRAMTDSLDEANSFLTAKGE